MQLIPGECIKWTLFSVPSWVKLGEGASLTCKFDLEGQNLYAVKWYKDGREIYRYVPAEKLTQQDFPMAGVNIDQDTHKQSEKLWGDLLPVSRRLTAMAQRDIAWIRAKPVLRRREVVRLRNVSLESTGRYKCEVLAESPKFMTLVKSGEMQVVDLPAGPPIVLGGQSEYEDGDLVNVTCITLPSMPPAQVTWYINGHEAPNDILYPHSTAAPLPQSPQHYPNNQYPFNQYPTGNSVGSARSSDHLQQSQPSLSHSRQSVKVTLAFTVRRYHFDRGNMTLRCEARVSELYTGQEELHARRKTTIRPALFGGRTSVIFIRLLAKLSLSSETEL
ncbi:hypothetical protein HAZT_HAZT008360 [Hyalella azteca]|uniref:Ig-like domain-containing protein n=1 Tax=Hyalella azteca TaxID=294128 RepID=A0A6A0GX31_HYAAZ|nr:hypothetical protein HAZT_HAZT008360 [Hyalella azteca]